MTMKKVTLGLVLCFVILLTACTSTNVSLELALCGSYAVPGMYCSDLKGGSFSCNILEEDTEGRMLYEYTTENIISKTKETALVICQRIDSDFIYYYEDCCFLLAEYSAQEVEKLKIDNDWGAPLDLSKMARRANKISHDLFIVSSNTLEHAIIQNACIQNFAIASQQLKELYFLDIDGQGKALYFLSIERNCAPETYLLIVDSAYHIKFLEITEGSIDVTDISSFKHNSGWAYGY